MSTVLLPGSPGVGNTTAIRKVAVDDRLYGAEALPGERLGGFYTEELSEHGRRRGFRAVTFDGWMRSIADVNYRGPARVGRYGLDVAATNALVERSLAAPEDAEIFLIDEVKYGRDSRPTSLLCLAERSVDPRSHRDWSRIDLADQEMASGQHRQCRFS